MVSAFSDEQLRAAINLADAYEAWVLAARDQPAHAARLAWKTIAGRQYLYRVRDRQGNATSLGPRTPETTALYDEHQANKADLRDRVARLSTALAESAAVYRALRLPMIDSYAARLFREFDIRHLLGEVVLAVGTTAMAAYQLEAAAHLDTPAHATRDIDLTWIAAAAPATPVLWEALKAIDETFVVNPERSFQARNRNAREVELLVGTERAATVVAEPLKPLPLPEQDWLYRGKPLRRIVCGLDGVPAALVVPDPRWFALHERWLADKTTCDPLKKPKDRRQAEALWQALRERMPHFPLDARLTRDLPAPLERVLGQLDAATRL